MSPSCRTVPLDDPEDRILAQPEPVADLSIGLALADKLQHFGRETVGLDSLTGSPTEDDATLSSRGDAGSHAFA
jgi:hypothetical protein